MLEPSNIKRWGLVAFIVVGLVLIGVLVYRFAYEEGSRTAHLVRDAEFAKARTDASSTAEALLELVETYSETLGLREGPRLGVGETGRISGWSLAVRQVEAIDVITTTGDTGQVVRPHNGRFWFIDMDISSKDGNTLESFRWYIIDKQGRMLQDAITDPNYTFGFSLYDLPIELRAPAYETEWLSGTSGDHAMLIFDTPADMVPVELIVQDGEDHIIFELFTK